MGKDIHQHNRAAIDAVWKIPEKKNCVQTGAYIKNLLAGITTVVNHETQIPIANELITVHQQAGLLHSAGFENNWNGNWTIPSTQAGP